jgi:PadR family transcriptional regulator, regulatory protein PadR
VPRQPHASAQTVSVLQALLTEPGQWHYGYQLGKETGLASGTLYPILIRLAEQHLLETRWEPPQRPGRPARHTYRLTAEGRQFARGRIADSIAKRRRQAARPAAEGAG